MNVADATLWQPERQRYVRACKCTNVADYQILSSLDLRYWKATNEAGLAATITRRDNHLDGEGPWYRSVLAYSYGRAGQLERARLALEKMSRPEQVGPVTMLWAHLGMGNKEEAPADLEKAYSEHFGILTTVEVEPAFDLLRGDPRFQDLLRRVGFAGYQHHRKKYLEALTLRRK